MRINFFLITLFTSSTAFALCSSLDIINIPTTIDLNNDISPKTVIQSSRQIHSQGCRYRLGVSAGGTGNYNRQLSDGINTIPFQIAKNNSMSRVLMAPNEAISNSNYHQHRYKANKGQDSKSFNIFAELDLTGNEPPGSYSSTYEILVFQKSGPNYNFFGSWPITYTYNIPENIFVSLVESSSPFDQYDNSQDLSFGALIQGSQKGFDIVIQSNSGYILDISSQNNGKLKHTGINSFIDYFFRLNGSLKSLANSNSSPIVISTGSGIHPSDGFRLPVQIEIGDTQNKLAGIYEDNLTITVTTNL